MATKKRAAVKTVAAPQDPEREVELVFTVRVKSYGKPDRTKQQVTDALKLALKHSFNPRAEITRVVTK